MYNISSAEPEQEPSNVMHLAGTSKMNRWSPAPDPAPAPAPAQTAMKV